MLRKYQREATDAMKENYPQRGNSIVCLAQAAGKSHVIAQFAKEMDIDILILAPTQELVLQDVEKLILAGIPKEEIGIYAASLKKKEVNKFTVGIINSVYKHPFDFEGIGCVIVDECDLVNTKDEGMYRDFFATIGIRKVYGLTATPYRNETNIVFYNNGDREFQTRLEVLTRDGGFWKDIIYCKNIKDLTPEYLVPVQYIRKPVIYRYELKENYSHTEYTDASIELAFRQKGKLEEMARIIKEAENTYRNILVFCPSVAIAKSLSLLIPKSEVVVGDTPSKDRTERVGEFKTGNIKTLISVGVLTTGFNFDALECIVLLRPTKSIRLYQQMVGRVMRKAKIYTGNLFEPVVEKKVGVLLDLTNTSRDMGPIDSMEIDTDEDKLWNLNSQMGWKHGELIGSYTKKR